MLRKPHIPFLIILASLVFTVSNASAGEHFTSCQLIGEEELDLIDESVILREGKAQRFLSKGRNILEAATETCSVSHNGNLNVFSLSSTKYIRYGTLKQDGEKDRTIYWFCEEAHSNLPLTEGEEFACNSKKLIENRGVSVAEKDWVGTKGYGPAKVCLEADDPFCSNEQLSKLHQDRRDSLNDLMAQFRYERKDMQASVEHDGKTFKGGLLDAEVQFEADELDCAKNVFCLETVLAKHVNLVQTWPMELAIDTSDLDGPTSWGGKIRSKPSINSSQSGSTKESEVFSSAIAVGQIWDGYDWFRVKTKSGKTGYQWGGIMCAPKHAKVSLCDYRPSP